MASGVLTTKGTWPARTSVPASTASAELSGPRSFWNVASATPGEAGWRVMPSIERNLSRFASGIRLLRYRRFSVRKANSWTIVTPGSLSLGLVHSGVWTWTRARAAATSWSNERSSRTGMGIDTVRLLTVEGDGHLQPLLLAGGDEGVGDGHVDVTRVTGIDRRRDVVQGDSRLPLLQSLLDLLLHDPKRGDGVGLEEE